VRTDIDRLELVFGHLSEDDPVAALRVNDMVPGSPSQGSEVEAG
jgi:hypothetical protein